MTPTPRQREEWEAKRQLALENINEKIANLEYCLDVMVRERDQLEAATIEDSYFEFISEQGSER